MNEEYNNTDTTMRNDLEELLAHYKAKLLDAEDADQEKNLSGIYCRLYELYQTDVDHGFSQEIKYLEEKRKNGEFQESIVRRTEETNFKNKELELKEKELSVKAHELDIREESSREGGKFINKPLAQTALTCATIILVDVVGLHMNASETPIKNIFERFMIKPTPRL